MRGRRPMMLLLVAAIGPLLAACTLAPGGMTSVAECADWADLSDPQSAFDSADMVVIGTPEPATGTAPMLGVDAAVHEVSVARVLKGDAEAGATLKVATTPETCTGDDVLYPNGDALETDGELLLFLTTPSTPGVRALVNPWDGAIPVPADADLPSDGGGTAQG